MRGRVWTVRPGLVWNAASVLWAPFPPPQFPRKSPAWTSFALTTRPPTAPYKPQNWDALILSFLRLVYAARSASSRNGLMISTSAAKRLAAEVLTT